MPFASEDGPTLGPSLIKAALDGGARPFDRLDRAQAQCFGGIAAFADFFHVAEEGQGSLQLGATAQAGEDGRGTIGSGMGKSSARFS